MITVNNFLIYIYFFKLIKLDGELLFIYGGKNLILKKAYFSNNTIQLSNLNFH